MAFKDVAEQNVGSLDTISNVIADIFGAGWATALWGGEIASETSVIFPILKQFNILVLMALSAMIIYIVCTGLIGTAQDGQVMGKSGKLHSTWTPIRSALSVSLLCPLPWAKGLSLIQVIILAFVGFSVGGANKTANVGVEYMKNNGGGVIASGPAFRKEALEIARVALNNAVIQYHQVYFQGEPELEGTSAFTIEEVGGIASDMKNVDIYEAKGGEFLKEQKGIDWTKQKPAFLITFKPVADLDKEDFGKIIIPIYRADNLENFTKSRKDAALKLIESCYTIAQKIVKYNHPDFNEFTKASLPEKDAFKNAISSYSASMDNALKSFNEDNGLKQELDEFAEVIKKRGFYSLGEYFWTITRFNQRINEKIGQAIQVQDLNKEALQTKISPIFNEVENSLNLASNYRTYSLKERTKIAESGKSESSNGIMAKVKNIISTPFKKLSESGIDYLTADEPLIGITSLGHKMVSTAEIIFTTYLGAYAAAKGFEKWNKGIWGTAASFFTGGATKAAGGAGGGVLAMLASIILPLCAVLYITGIMLAYFLPSIPFIIWITTLVMWLILIIEALVAAPLWALAHAIPGGEGIAGEHGKQGYVLFIHILLYPVLLVIAFFTCMLALSVLKFIGQSFAVFFAGLMGNHEYFSITAALASLVLAVYVMYSVSLKLFNIISWLPENVIKWLGNTGHTLGISAEREHTQVIGVASGKTEKVVQGAESGVRKT